MLSEQDRGVLERWEVPLEYAVGWLAEVQRHEGAQILTEWVTRLEGDRIVQELTPRG